MTLSLGTAYRSFGGEVEASSTPTICRLPDSRRHQLWAIAPPSPTDSNAASGPTSVTKPMPVDATSDASTSPVNVVATSSRSPSPSTVESPAPITGSVYKPVQTTLSSAPAVEYNCKAQENQSRETLDGGRPASLLG